MPRSVERPQVSIRFDAKTYYLLELSTRITDQSTSDVIRDALKLYFTTISPHSIEEFEEPFPGRDVPTLEQREKRLSEAEKQLATRSLASLADLLWFDDATKRLQMLAGAFPRLVTPDEQKQLGKVKI